MTVVEPFGTAHGYTPEQTAAAGHPLANLIALENSLELLPRLLRVPAKALLVKAATTVYRFLPYSEASVLEVGRAVDAVREHGWLALVPETIQAEVAQQYPHLEAAAAVLLTRAGRRA